MLLIVQSGYLVYLLFFLQHSLVSWTQKKSVFYPTLQEPSSVEKIMEIDEHIGCAMSGLIADARTLVEHARVETQVLSNFLIILCCGITTNKVDIY